MITDSSGIIQAANRSACEILNIPPDQAVGKKVTQFIVPADQPVVDHYIQASLDDLKSHTVTVELLQDRQPRQMVTLSLHTAPSDHSKESFLYWTLQPNPVDRAQSDEQKKFAQAEAAIRFRDTLLQNAATEQRRVRFALQKSTAHFRTIFEQANLGIQLLDLDGRIAESNPAFEKMVGYSLEELRQMRLNDITHLEDLEFSKNQFLLLISGKIGTCNNQLRLIHKNGNIVWTRQIMSLFRNEEGQPQYVIGMLENITLQKQMEIELHEVQQRLIESRETERLRLAQDLHDGPVQELYGISYQLSSLWSSFGDPNSYPQVKIIEEALEGVIDSLRQVCGELRPPTLAPFGLEKAITSHAQGLQKTSPNLSITLDLMNDRKTLPENIRLALFRIYQIAIANVIRHAEAKNVLIHFAFDENQVILTIQDDGKGFQFPNRWVEMVRHGHFGLVGAAERAQSIGGMLKIESQPGQGTVVRVIVPRHPPLSPDSGENPSFIYREIHS
jgi:PAS domain S-box-containing protein